MIYTLQNIEYMVESGRPVIWIFARDENKVQSTLKVKDFKPYFYILQGERYKTTGEKDIFATDIKTKGIYGEDVLRVNVKVPSDVAKKRKDFIKTWESDILFPIRFMIDMDLYSTFEYRDGQVYPVDAEPVPPRVCFLDIEVGTPKDDWSKPFEAKHEVICISLYDSYIQNLTTMIYHPDPDKIKPRKNLEIYDNENALLEAFIAKINSMSPDLISGWSILDFDLPYLITRMRKQNINPHGLSPLSYTRIEEGEGFYKGARVYIKGLGILDLLSSYRKFFAKAFPSYALQAIAQKDLGESKIEIKDFRKTWLENPDKIIKRNAMDVEFLHRIDKKWGLIAHYTELKNLIGTVYDGILSSKKLVDIEMLRKARERKISLPRAIKVEDTESFVGAYVMVPKPGIHKNVIVLDFKSLYPEIFKTFNISPETFTTDSTDAYKVNKWFFKKTPMGILPECIAELMDKRNEVKKEMNKHKEGTSEYDRLNSKQKTIKYLINAHYGVMAYKNFRLYKKDVAEAITLTAQKYTRNTITMLKSWGYEILASDTDSVFVKLIANDLDDCLAQGTSLANRVTKELSNIMGSSDVVLEFEKVYSKILFGKVKKRYAGIKVWDKGQETNKLDVTGFEVKRSDSATVSIDIQKNVMNLLLTEDEPTEKVQGVLRDLQDKFNDLPFMDIAIPKGVKKNLDEYGGINVKGGKIGIPAVVRGAIYANKCFGTNFGGGSKPRVLYVSYMPNGYEDTDVVCFDEDTILPDGIIPDYPKMWKTIVKKKIQPLLDIIEQDFDELIDMGRQTKIDEF